MSNLNESLDVLYELDELREKAKALCERGRDSLKEIQSIEGGTVNAGNILYKKWASTGNKIEAALLVKVQHHRNLSIYQKNNDDAKTYPDLQKMLRLNFDDLFTKLDEEDEARHPQIILDKRIPVLLAARTMHALVDRSSTVLSTETMLCYYRIVRELYTATKPDWTVGAARAGEGGNISAFVTGNCISAILALKHSITRTVEFFKHTHDLCERHATLKQMIDIAGEELTSDTRRWADKAIERMWLDWHISCDPRLGEIAFHSGADNSVNQLFQNSSEKIDMDSVGEYLDGLLNNLEEAICRVEENIRKAETEIVNYRDNIEFSDETVPQTGKQNLLDGEIKRDQNKNDKDPHAHSRTEHAHSFALEIVKKALEQATQGLEICRNKEKSLLEKLRELSKQFVTVSRRIHRVLEPSKKYIETVLNRELAEPEDRQVDAGELVFAAAAFGAMTDWRQKERLNRTCQRLIRIMPDTGILFTRKPIHSTKRGYKLLPIGCDITRRLAQLLERTGYEFDPKFVRRMLSLVEDNLITITTEDDTKSQIGWNFEGATEAEIPSVWVTAATVLALDRIVRMLNTRVNEIIFRHFEVIRPEQSRTNLTLNELLYPDYGIEGNGIAIHLEQMRAHLMRATLPEIYKKDKKKVFSTILFGPPQTGKTTLAESLALSSKAPLIMLSPFDLTLVEAGQSIEGRARAVFETLSMLTQTVILFDEFETVLQSRQAMKSRQGKDGKETSETKVDTSSQPNGFLLTGMLPKLIKLHDAAQKHSSVYFLATNDLDKMDPAAIRPGRFDAQLEVKNPDRFSRKGAFLYRLGKIISKLDERPHFKEEWQKRLDELLIETEEKAANILANEYFRIPDWVGSESYIPKDWEKGAQYFARVVNGPSNGLTD